MVVKSLKVKKVFTLKGDFKNTNLFAVSSCPGPLDMIANGGYVTLQGDAATSPAPAVGTIVEITCSAGYEQTRGLPYYACQREGQTVSWSGELFDDSAKPICEREYIFAETTRQLCENMRISNTSMVNLQSC